MVDGAFENGRPVWEQVVRAEALQRRARHSGNRQLVSDQRGAWARRLYSLLMMPNTNAGLLEPLISNRRVRSKSHPAAVGLFPTILTWVLKRFLTAATWSSRPEAPSVGGYLNSTARAAVGISPRVMNYSCSGRARQGLSAVTLAASVIMSCCCGAPRFCTPPH